MTVHLDAPDWVHDTIAEWLKRFELTNWEVSFKLHQCIDDNPDIRAQVEVWQNRHLACLKIRADVEDTPEWRRTLIHECCHILHERVDQLLREVVAPELPHDARRPVSAAYSNVLEEYTDQLTWVLWRLSVVEPLEQTVEARKNGRKKRKAKESA